MKKATIRRCHVCERALRSKTERGRSTRRDRITCSSACRQLLRRRRIADERAARRQAPEAGQILRVGQRLPKRQPPVAPGSPIS